MKATQFALVAVLLPLNAIGEEIPPFTGSVERLAPSFDSLISRDAQIEVLATGFNWSEGPAWYQDRVIFSDVPENTAFQWKEGDPTASVFLKPSGLTGKSDSDRPQGSNGLATDADGHLILCQHGDRRIAKLEKDGRFTSLADRFEGKRFNSPNDLVVAKNGSIYFTDPPYGLSGMNDSPAKELDFNGVFHLAPDGTVTALIRDLTFPNGIGLSPDEKTLYVAVSDPEGTHIVAYTLDGAGTRVSGRRLLFDAEPLKALPNHPGACDGLAVDTVGNIWTTGPGGVLVLTPEGKHIGSILTGQRTGNCTFGGPEKSHIYITADMFLLRVKTRIQGM